MRVVLRGKAGTYTHRSSTEFPDQVHHVLEPPKRWLPFAITYAYILHSPYMHILQSLCQVEQRDHNFLWRISWITVFQDGISVLLKLPIQNFMEAIQKRLSLQDHHKDADQGHYMNSCQ